MKRMKKIFRVMSMVLILTICLSSFALASEDKQNDDKIWSSYGEGKIVNSKSPRVSSKVVNGIMARKIVSNSGPEMPEEELSRLVELNLDIEEAEIVYNKNSSVENLEALNALISEKKDIEQAILDKGTIKLTQNEVNLMLGGTNNELTSDDPYCPPDTGNTDYYMSSIYTTNTDIGPVEYYVVTAIPISTRSNMIESWDIDVNADMIQEYVDTIVDIYVGKVTGSIIGSLKWWIDFLPYELLLDAPSSASTTTATYRIDATYASTMRYIWCYSPTFDEYFLGLVLHKTSVRDDHIMHYVYNGKVGGDHYEEEYTLYSDNYLSFTSIVREYWESSEYIHEEYVDRIRYKYEGDTVETLSPPYAPNYGYLN